LVLFSDALPANPEKRTAQNFQAVGGPWKFRRLYNGWRKVLFARFFLQEKA